MANYLVIQGLFNCLIKKTKKNQEFLENKDMGPEIIQLDHPRGNVHSQYLKLLPVIQYLPISLNN